MGSPDDWQEYLWAAERKIEMANFSAATLRDALAKGHPGGPPDVAQQTFFEGVLYAFVAASDQVAEAIVLALSFNLGKANLQMALEAMPKSRLRKDLFAWWQTPIATDLRDIRRRATHHYYRKTPQGPLVEVQLPQSARPYPGPRALDAYCDAAVSHLNELKSLIDGLRSFLEGHTADRQL